MISGINTGSKLVSGLTKLKDPSAVLPTLLIEGACTAGRTHQSYKRGGKLEAAERFREEATSAVFWLWGVKWFNKLGDFLGSKLGMKDIATDVGKDALRDPAFALSNKTKIFKFSKIIASVGLATAVMGFVVPKINHAITARAMKKQKNAQETQQSLQNIPSMDNFILNAKNKTQNANLAFKGGNFVDFLTRASYNLENNNTWRLVSTDAGMVAGRVANSRHPVEATEYLFRDVSSVFFYNFATGIVINQLNKALKTPSAHPQALARTGDFLKEKLGEGVLNPEEFLEKFVNKTNNYSALEVPFSENDTISAREFIKFLETHNINRKTEPDLIKKTIQMSRLQPRYQGEKILSKQQVEDIFSSAIISDPKFLRTTINAATDGRACDPTKFVSRKVTEQARESITEFCEWIAKQAKGGNIDAKFIDKMTKKSLRFSTAYQIAGMGVSALGLAVLIPKLQTVVSRKLHGDATFEEIAQGKENKAAK